MSNYIYAVADDNTNRLHTVSAASIKSAEEKVIEQYREDWEIDEEFNNYREFKEYMLDYGYIFSAIQDIEAI